MKFPILAVLLCVCFSIVVTAQVENSFTFFNDETYDTIDITPKTEFVKAHLFSDDNIDIYIDGNECEKGKYDEYFCTEFSNGNVYIDAKPSESGIVEWIIYHNKRNAQIDVFGTEYEQGDQVRTFLQLVDNNIAINNASCFVTIINPDNTIFKLDQIMTHYPDNNGLYFFDTIAEKAGNHMVSAQCSFETNETHHYPFELTVLTGVDKGHPISRVQVDDNVYQETEDTAQVIDVLYNFTGIDISGFNQTDLTLNLNGILEVGGGKTGAAELSILNYTSGLYIPFINHWIGNDNNEDTVSNTIPKDWFNDTIDGTNIVIRINDTADPAQDLKKFKIDLLEIIEFDFLIEQVEEIRGGGEIHVSVPVANITLKINDSIIQNINTNLLTINESLHINDNLNTQNLVTLIQNVNASLDANDIEIISRLIAANLSLEQLIVFSTDINNSVNSFSTQILQTVLNVNDSIIQEIQSSNIDINAAIANALSGINFNTNTSIAENKNIIINQLNDNFSTTINQITTSENNIIISIDGQTVALNNTMQASLAEILLNLTNMQASIENLITQTQTAIITYIGSQHTILNGTINSLQSLLTGQISDINTSIQENDNQNTNTIINALSININSSQAVLIGAIGNDTTIIENIITRETEILNISIDNAETEIINQLNSAIIGLNFSINDLILNQTEFLSIEGFSLNVLATDYSPGDNARVFLQLTENNIASNDAFCQVSIHTPSSIESSVDYLLQDNFMINMGIDGLYFVDFTVPNENGVYMVSGECFVGINTTYVGALNDTVLEGSIISGSISDILISDDSYYQLEEQNNGGGNRSYVHEFWFDITGFGEVTNQTDRVGVIVFEGRLNPDDLEFLEFQAFNFTSNEFVTFNNLLSSQAGGVDQIITNGPDTLEGHFRNSENLSLIRIQDTVQSGDSVNHEIRIDRMQLATTTRIAETITVAGGGELNVRNSTSVILTTLNESLNELFSEFIGNDTAQLISEIGNDTNYIINTLNSNFGNDSQIIIDAILQNTTLDIDSLQIETIQTLQSINNSLYSLIISENTDTQNQLTSMLTDLLVNINLSEDRIISELGIYINNSEVIIVSAIGNDTTFLTNHITQQTSVLNASILNAETFITNEIYTSFNNLSILLDEQTALLNTNNTEIILDEIDISEQNIIDQLNYTIIAKTDILLSKIGNDTSQIINQITTSETNVLNYLDSLNLSIETFFNNYIGNDTPSLLSAIGNDTQYIIDTLNKDFGNDTQIIIDSILTNTTIDIDSLDFDTKARLESMNNSLRSLIISETNDIQSDLVSEINDVQTDISTQTSTITSSITTNANIILNAIQDHNVSIEEYISSINVSVDTFLISEEIWNYYNRTLSNFIFNVSLENTTVVLDDDTTNLITGNIPAEFEVGTCFQNQNSSILLGVFLLIAIIMILIGFGTPWVGVFGSLGMMILSWYIASCVGMIGYVIAAIGIVGIIFFVTRRNPLG